MYHLILQCLENFLHRQQLNLALLHALQQMLGLQEMLRKHRFLFCHIFQDYWESRLLRQIAIHFEDYQDQVDKGHW